MNDRKIVRWFCRESSKSDRRLGNYASVMDLPCLVGTNTNTSKTATFETTFAQRAPRILSCQTDASSHNKGSASHLKWCTSFWCPRPSLQTPKNSLIDTIPLLRRCKRKTSCVNLMSNLDTIPLRDPTNAIAKRSQILSMNKN